MIRIKIAQLQNARTGGNTEARRHGGIPERGESRARTGGNTEAQRHGEKPGVGEGQGRWKARGGGLSSGGELGQWCRAGDVLS